MILEGIMNAIMSLLKNVLGFINIPNFPEELVNGVYTIIDMIFDNLGIVGLFVRWQTIVIGVPLVLVVTNVERIYHLVMWVIRKIPVVSMS